MALASIESVASACFLGSSWDSWMASLTTFVTRSCDVSGTITCALTTCARWTSFPSMSSRQTLSNLIKIFCLAPVDPDAMKAARRRWRCSSRIDLRQDDLYVGGGRCADGGLHRRRGCAASPRQPKGHGSGT